MGKYSVVTFAPVQGFIEKSRKLRDLYGASLILSYLSKKIAKHVDQDPDLRLISPASPNILKGMPNRILIKGELTKETAEHIILCSWKELLKHCREWIEGNITNCGPYYWEREWSLWGSHAWEVFQGSGDTIIAAMSDLEVKKLSRDWSAVNWIGESSSLSGSDGIAFPDLGSSHRNPQTLNYGWEKEQIQNFYTELAKLTDNTEEENPEGKFIAVNEKLSIPELVKRLITWHEIQHRIDLERSLANFREIQRKPTETSKGQWTGWFMGDGDRVGYHLQKLARMEDPDTAIHNFSLAIRQWGRDFERGFDLGKVVYAGGDDFLGVIYSQDPSLSVSPLTAYEWLLGLNDTWKKHEQEISLSVGFVWVAGSVPQRDVLQHCREAEKVAKSRGRNRITMRILFNSGQYVQWTCPWDYLDILTKYKDREGKANWSHIYQDLAYLKSRRAFDIDDRTNVSKTKLVEITALVTALHFLDLYFPSQDSEPSLVTTLINQMNKNQEELAQKLSGFSDDADTIEKAKAIIDWITDLVEVGWHLCSIT